MEEQPEAQQKSTENNTTRHEVPELPLLRNCLFPEQFSDVPFRFRYQPQEGLHINSGSHLVVTTGSQVHEGHYMTSSQMGGVSDVTTGVHDVIVTSEASRTNEQTLLSHDLQIHDHSELELPPSGSLEQISYPADNGTLNETSGHQLDSSTGTSSSASGSTPDAPSQTDEPSPPGEQQQILDTATGVLQDTSASGSPLDPTVSIDSPQEASPCMEEIGTSRMDRQTPDMSLSSSLSTNLNSSVNSSPMTPLNQDCPSMATPEVNTPVSSASFLHQDSGIEDSGHSSAQKCSSSLLETSCQDDSLVSRPSDEPPHMSYRTLDYGLMGLYPTSPYTQPYPMEPTFSQRFGYPRDIRTDHMFTGSHSMMETHDDSGIESVPRPATYYNFQPMTPNSNLANWLSQTNQIPMTSSRVHRPEDQMTPSGHRSTQSNADSSGDVVCEKPPDTYISLISQAILNSPEQRLILSEIYKYIRNTYPYYKTADDTWKNAIRHNLSVNECFVKNGRAPNGRGYYWSIHPACVRSFMEGDFRRREARRLARDANKTREGQLSKQSQGRVTETAATTPRRGRSMTLAKVMGLPSPSPMMPASPALIPMTCTSYYPSHPTTTHSTSSPIPPPPPLSYPHPYLSAYYSPSSSYSLPYPPLPSPISNPQSSYSHMTPHVNPASFSLSIPTIYGNLPSSNNSSNPSKGEYQS